MRSLIRMRHPICRDNFGGFECDSFTLDTNGSNSACTDDMSEHCLCSFNEGSLKLNNAKSRGVGVSDLEVDDRVAEGRERNHHVAM